MKRLISLLLVVVLSLSIMPMQTVSAEEGSFILPAEMVTIEEEAFSGNTGLVSLVIPKQVESISSKAFADCTNLKEVYFGKNDSIQIAADAFAGCEDLHFFVYPNTPGELFALSHGYTCDLLEEGSDFLKRAMTLVANNGGSTILQSGEFASKRLITLRKNNKLPDISAYQPTAILRDEDLFILQFNTVDNAAECFSFLQSHEQTIFVEPDECVEALDSVSGAGIVDPGVWDTEDPMGFDIYAPFVAEHGTGSVKIAVIDSGVAKMGSYESRLDKGNAKNMLAEEDHQEWYDDFNRHGTVIASVINDCVGNANVKILPIRVVGAAGTTDFVLLGNGIKYAVACGAKIINLSMNFKESDYVSYCLRQAMAAGVKVVVAAGNSGRNIANVYPANVSGVITVSGLTSNYQLSANSNYGAQVSYCAPDSYIKTSAYTYSLFNGTSFAAPMIASAIALVQMDPYHTLADMNKTCYLSNDTDSPANSYGKGMPILEPLADIPVESIAFSNELPDVMKVGERIELSWVFTPANATNKTVTVTSDNNNILSVENEENGNVFMVANTAGTATLTAVSASTGVQVSRTFTVVKPVEKITITGGKDQLSITKTMKLAAVVEPNDATNTTVEWKSTNDNIATVSSTGPITSLVTPYVSGKRVGIYAQATDGYGARSETLWVDIVEVPDPEEIVLTINDKVVTDGEIQMTPGSILELRANVLPDGADQEVDLHVLGKYVSVDQIGVVTTGDKQGTFFAVEAGRTSGISYILVTSKDGKSCAELQVDVVIPPTSITIEGETTIDEGATTKLTATVFPDNATDKTVTWSSSDPCVTVTGGVVRGVRAGTAIIKATANGDNSVTAQLNVTVKHPFTINFDANTPEKGVLTPTVSSSSMRAYSGDELGTLPTASCDYYEFLGWYTEPSGGTLITSASSLNPEGASQTLYAQWRIHDKSEWVLTSLVPTGARIIDTSYSYRVSKESTKASESGWITTNDSYWKKTGSGSKDYATFPSTYPTKFPGENAGNAGKQTLRSTMSASPYTASDDGSTKMEVSNVHGGWIYWHWMYSVQYASGTGRAIYHKEGKGPDNGFGYKYFYEIKSTTNCPYLDNKYCNSENKPSYNCHNIIPSNANKSSNSGLGTDRFFRFEYFTSTYTSYQKMYKYYKDVNYDEKDPGSGSNGETISNKVTYVKYRAK